MSEELRFWLRLLPNLFGMGFCIVCAFAQIADFMLYHRPRSILGATIFLTLAPIFFLRALAIPEPPLIADELVIDLSAIAWAFCMVQAFAWGAWRLWDNYQLGLAEYRLRKSAERKH